MIKSILVALALAASFALALPAGTTRTFTALTMNVGGLPAIVNDNGAADKTAEATEIGQRFKSGGYNLIAVQEDFNYHAAIYKGATLPSRTPTSGGVPFGSGLNTLSTFEFKGDVERVKWSKCNLNEGDCLTPKGFTKQTIVLSPGAAEVDVYDLHTDAGDDSGDHTARHANLAQLTTYIQAHSANRAVIVLGDTNSRYTNAVDGLADFVHANGLTDPWIKLHRNGVEPAAGTTALACADESGKDNTCETVDKIFYRGSASLKLNVTDWRYAASDFSGQDGKLLSDHAPVLATFQWTV